MYKEIYSLLGVSMGAPPGVRDTSYRVRRLRVLDFYFDPAFSRFSIDTIRLSVKAADLMRLVSTLIFLVAFQHVEASPLFEEGPGQLLAVVIETDLSKIKNEKSEYHSSTDNYIDSRFQLRDKVFDIRLQTRGHNRLARCKFPPLRIRFDKSDIKNSILSDNHNLKIVTHCDEDELELLFREYLVYKIYNVITPHSFQVRLLKIRYTDIKGMEDAIDTYAFFIESTKSVENRLNLDELESGQKFNMKTHANIAKNWPGISQTSLQNAFQHLIRNNDWVIYYTEPTRTLSLANVKIFHDEKEGYPFPYDFDLAGLVTWDLENYEYRYGNENLCGNVEMKQALLKVLGHKDECMQLLEHDPLLSTSYKKNLTAYLSKLESVDDFCSGVN